MAVDTPATIAIIGAGPIGLEAALYARFLGYDVQVFEQNVVASNVLSWGQTRMLSPFEMNCSSLGLAALHAQDETFKPPHADEYLTVEAWVKHYLLRLATTDLLDGNIRTGCRVMSVGRPESLKADDTTPDDRADQPFRLLLCDEAGQEHTETADVVIDTSGNHGDPLGLGAGGLPAIGERDVRSKIDYRIPNVLGEDEADFADQHTLVFGAGVIAACTVIALTELAEKRIDTRVIWVTRNADSDHGPVPVPSNETLPRRRELAERANHLATRGHPALKWLPNRSLESLHLVQDRELFRIVMTGDQQEWRFRRIVADVGFRPELSIFRELRVQTCPVTESVGGSEGNRPQKMILGEPDFYVLGAKSEGRGNGFHFSMGIEQIRQLFTIIGDREDLDLYATARSLPR